MLATISGREEIVLLITTMMNIGGVRVQMYVEHVGKVPMSTKHWKVSSRGTRSIQALTLVEVNEQPITVENAGTCCGGLACAAHPMCDISKSRLLQPSDPSSLHVFEWIQDPAGVLYGR